VLLEGVAVANHRDDIRHKEGGAEQDEDDVNGDAAAAEECVLVGA
jgi:hypothetical protein